MINSGTVAASTSVTTGSLIHVPAGPATLILANQGTAATVYVGSGTAVTTANGFPILSSGASPTVIPIYAGNPATTWGCVTANGAATLAWLISAPSGGTGTGTLG